MASPQAVSILLVDDQPRNVLALEAALGSIDCSLVGANSGPAALRCVLAQDFAVILLDIHMPGMGGFETASLIRARQRSHSTPIIFLTADDRGGERVQEGYRLGAVDYIQKPFDAEILRAKVAVFVELFRKTLALEQRTAELTQVTGELVRREQQIGALNAELEQRVVERTGELEAAIKEMEAFSYSISHDLRAPLRAVNGFSKILLEDHAAQLSEEGQAYLRRVGDSAHYMGELIDGLLKFSRLSRQPLHKQAVRTEEVVRRALGELDAEQIGREVDIKIGELLPCEGNVTLLTQVFVNLLSNALKFTLRREVAHIEVGCHQAEREVIYFVRDNGTGFDMQYADKLFGVFQRLHRAEDYDGTGVGLAIVQRIVQRHGGRIWAEAALDEGATFSFTLGPPQVTVTTDESPLHSPVHAD
jgi:two-component system sensor histidine kinase/response regulator